MLVTFVQGIIKEEVAAAKSRLGGRRRVAPLCQRTADRVAVRGGASAQALSVPLAPRPLIADRHASHSLAFVRTINKFIIIQL